MKPQQTTDGILVVNKPKGMTSFDVVAKIRKKFSQKKVGHAGTLDPSVEGVLVIALGKATKLIDELQTRPKTYIGEISLGFSTETEDLDGDIVEKISITQPFTDQQIDAAMASLNGNIIQVPPMYSAVKVAGRRLYEYARSGERVERPQRDATIYDYHRTSATTLEDDVQKFSFVAQVSKGTYIRTLAVDTGNALQIPATMSYLKRVSGSGFGIDQAHDLADIIATSDTELRQLVVPISDVLTWSQHNLSQDEWFKVKNGQKISVDDWPANEEPKMLYFNSELKAVYVFDHDKLLWRSRYVFSNE
ncbi:tRNA pseudouridine(55) synthase TruB [Leuconostoc fallax]|uniref:tRNA pseudouridine(55) synthase TruB n=1 Tax=Leuconostoc fallax TaxID=1251 RepID=UPI002091B1F4|nr:tRNA pseudouridine(55) synthase TruB [Leuconostoc fallax]MCO6183632.1 tRNA pseudouridine(55) synthase TruB [Leuconostoc fallax]